MDVEMFTGVRLKDGREGCVVHEDSPTTYLVDIGDSPKDWETVSVPRTDIVEILYTPSKNPLLPDDEQ